MSFPIALLRDDFTNNTEDPAWAASSASGSATRTETGGQARLTLPSSTAGTHTAYYRTSGAYDLTGDGFVWNIDTMVATGVAATAILDLRSSDNQNALRWTQTSGTLKAQTVLAGVATDRYSVAWNATTYKYLRVRESGGTIFFDSSSNGTSWTNRASVAAPFSVTDLYVQFAATCGNVASPGSLRLEDVNLILPAPSATWRETTADWSIANRLRSVTLASDGGKQGVLVTADTMDASRALGGTVRYFAGPLGSSSGGYLQLTEYASLALAQGSPFPIPVDGRVDLPAMVDARYMRLYHRSIDASAHTIREFVPRRLVQADDIEAESITAINIAAGAVIADKIFVISLAAITASMGSLHMDGVIDIEPTGGIYQGSGTFAAPTTGVKLFNSGGVGKLSGYNTGVEQITLDTDGKLKAGAGVVVLDANGVGITGPAFSYGLYNASPVTTPRVNMVQWSKSSGSQAASILGSASSQLLLLADKITLAIPLSASASYGLNLQANGAHSMTADTFGVNFGGASGDNAITVQTHATNKGSVSVHGTFNSVRSGGSARFAMDTTTEGSAISLANNATATPFGNSNNFGGLILINETSAFGSPGLFLTGGGAMVEIADPGAKYSTTAGTASMINIFFVSGGITIENKTGSTISLNVCAIRNRVVN